VWKSKRSKIPLKHAIHAAKDGEGQNDFAVFRLLVAPAQQIGDGPYKGGKAHAFEIQVEGVPILARRL
jgi:hypothetical protein